MAIIQIHLKDINKYENLVVKKISVIQHLRGVAGLTLQAARELTNKMVDGGVFEIRGIDLEVDDTINLTTNTHLKALRDMGFYVKGTSDYYAYKEIINPIIVKALAEDRLSAAAHLTEALKDIKSCKV